MGDFIWIVAAFLCGMTVGFANSISTVEVDSGKQFKAGDAIYQCSVINKLEVK